MGRLRGGLLTSRSKDGIGRSHGKEIVHVRGNKSERERETYGKKAFVLEIGGRFMLFKPRSGCVIIIYT